MPICLSAPGGGEDGAALVPRQVRWGMTLRPRTYRARRLRRCSTDAERKLWNALRKLRLPYKVRRQNPIGRHIADFAIPACKIVIEIDGGQHALVYEQDASRTRSLEARGYRVIRFWNTDVLNNLEGVIETILSQINCPPHLSLTLSAPEGREGKQAKPNGARA